MLVTGATGHLGRAITEGLLSQGAEVLVNGRDNGEVLAYVASLCKEGLSAKAAVFDVSNKSQVRQYFKSCPFSAINALVLNAYSGGSGDILHVTDDDYVNSYEISVIANQRLFRQAFPFLLAARNACGDASVVGISSMYGMVSPRLRLYEGPKLANPAFYGAAKAAFTQWLRYAACQFGEEGIRFNAISLGPFPNASKASTGFLNRLIGQVPLARVGEPSEVVGPVIYLVSSASSFSTGSNLVVDGGWTAW